MRASKAGPIADKIMEHFGSPEASNAPLAFFVMANGEIHPRLVTDPPSGRRHTLALVIEFHRLIEEVEDRAMYLPQEGVD